MPKIKIEAAARIKASGNDNTPSLQELDTAQDSLAKAIEYFARARTKLAAHPKLAKQATKVGQAIKEAHTEMQILIEELEEQ